MGRARKKQADGNANNRFSQGDTATATEEPVVDFEAKQPETVGEKMIQYLMQVNTNEDIKVRSAKFEEAIAVMQSKDVLRNLSDEDAFSIGEQIVLGMRDKFFDSVQPKNINERLFTAGVIDSPDIEGFEKEFDIKMDSPEATSFAVCEFLNEFRETAPKPPKNNTYNKSYITERVTNGYRRAMLQQLSYKMHQEPAKYIEQLTGESTENPKIIEAFKFSIMPFNEDGTIGKEHLINPNADQQRREYFSEYLTSLESQVGLKLFGQEDLAYVRDKDKDKDEMIGAATNFWEAAFRTRKSTKTQKEGPLKTEEKGGLGKFLMNDMRRYAPSAGSKYTVDPDTNQLVHVKPQKN